MYPEHAGDELVEFILPLYAVANVINCIEEKYKIQDGGGLVVVSKQAVKQMVHVDSGRIVRDLEKYRNHLLGKAQSYDPCQA